MAKKNVANHKHRTLKVFISEYKHFYLKSMKIIFHAPEFWLGLCGMLWQKL